MIDEQALRTVLHNEADRHVVNPLLGTSAIARARWSRLTHFAGACGAVAAIAFVGIGVVSQVSTGSQQIAPAAGSAGSPNAIASGTTPDGDTWTLSSAPASQWPTSTAEGLREEGGHCFGLTAGADDGRHATCHAMPDNIDEWLHLGSTRLAENGQDTGAALYGEVSKRVETIEITLRSGEVVAPDVIEVSDGPYGYFVAFLDPQARGEVAAYDHEGDLVSAREFLLDRGALSDDMQ